MEVGMLTTWDNPYSPFTQYDQWHAFDSSMGYHTPEYLARIANTSIALSDAQNDKIIDDAINEIVALNILGIYRKVYEKDYKDGDNSAEETKDDGNSEGTE